MLLWIKSNQISTQTNYLSLATTTPQHANPKVLNFLTLVFKQQITIVSNTKYTTKYIKKEKKKGSNKLDKQINTTNTWDFLLGGGVAFEFMRH